MVLEDTHNQPLLYAVLRTRGLRVYVGPSARFTQTRVLINVIIKQVMSVLF
jgi:hypothetical protein